MKKSISLKIGLICACLALITCFFVGTTLAKYTTSANTGDKSATVAKWGVKVTTTADAAFKTTYDPDTTVDGITAAVASTSETLAPGTSGKLVEVTITGTPEVAVGITRTANLSLTNWALPDSTEYMPVVFTVVKGSNRVTYQVGTGTESDTAKYFATAAALEEAIEAAITGGTTATDGSMTNTVNVNANAGLDTTYDVSVEWEWAFEGDDAKDTALGDLETRPEISINVVTTVTQIN